MDLKTYVSVVLSLKHFGGELFITEQLLELTSNSFYCICITFTADQGPVATVLQNTK